MKKDVSPPPATDAGETDLVSKKVTPPPPSTGAVQGTRVVKRDVSPSAGAVPKVRKATDELGRDPTGVLFSNPLILHAYPKFRKKCMIC